MAKLIDLTGQVFGRLTVLERVLNPKSVTKSGKRRTGAWWRCLCECGNLKDLSAHNLCSGNSTSCGCLHREQLAERVRAAETEPPWVADMAIYRRKLKSRSLHPKLKPGSNQFGGETGTVRSIPWHLSIEEYSVLVTGICFYCGAPPSMIPHGKIMGQLGLLKNGIDRVDNDAGYTLANCVPCCTTCNRDKRDRTQSDFILHTVRRYQHLVAAGLVTT
jgi:hypothetical protein